MLVRFNEVSPKGSHFELSQIEGVTPEDGFAIFGPMKAECLLTRKSDDKIELQGQLSATLLLSCDRCLGQYEFPVNTGMQVLFEIASDKAWHVQELECQRLEELDQVILDEPTIDLDDVFRQQLLLALPVKHLCADACKGICSQCGANLNSDSCRCAGQQESSPFAVLAQLKRVK